MKKNICLLLCSLIMQGSIFASEEDFLPQGNQSVEEGKNQKNLVLCHLELIKKNRRPCYDWKCRKCKGKRGKPGATGATGETGETGPAGGSYGQYISAISTSDAFFCTGDPLIFTSIYAQAGIQLENQTTFVIQQDGTYSICVWFDSNNPGSDLAFLETTGSVSNSIAIASIIPFTFDLDLAANDEVTIQHLPPFAAQTRRGDKYFLFFLSLYLMFC